MKPISNNIMNAPKEALSTLFKTNAVLSHSQPAPSNEIPPIFYPFHNGSYNGQSAEMKISAVPSSPFLVQKVVPLRNDENFNASKFNKNYESKNELNIKKPKSKISTISNNKGCKIENKNVVNKVEVKTVDKTALKLEKLNIK